MKKIIALFLASVLVVSYSITAFAADSDKTTEIDVYAKVEYSIDGEYMASVQNAEASITTPYSTLSVINVPVNAVTLVVIPMEGEALNWIDSCVVGNTKAAYDIFFRDANGNRINSDDVEVSISVAETDLTVSSVNTDGSDQVLLSEVASGKISFTTDGSRYYVITKISEDRPGDTITVPVRGEENEIHADVTIDDDTVELHELDFEEIDHIVGDHVNTGIVEIDLTGLDEEITKIELPMASIKHIVEAAEEAHNDTEALQIDFPLGSVKLDDKTMRAVVDQVEGNQVILVLESVGATRLNDKQEAAIKDMKVYEGYEAYLLCTNSNKRISDFKGGVATLSVPFIIPEGLEADGFTVLHIGDDGNKEELDTWYTDSHLHWSVGHFSDFVIVYEEPQDNDDGNGDNNGNDQTPGSDNENTPDPENTPTSIESPPTGDSSSLVLWITLLIGSCLVLMILIRKKEAE